MIDMVKNRKRLEQEKKKFQGPDSYDCYYDNFRKLLEEKEDDPELKDYIKEYREIDAWLMRYSIKDRNTTPQSETEEEAKIALGKMLRDTDAKYSQLVDLEDKILKTYYRQILKVET